MNMAPAKPLLKPAPVKICGLKTDVDVAAALDGGAAFLGFMIFGPSPRNVSPEAAGALAAPASTMTYSHLSVCSLSRGT